jgi:hypothetical protein
VPTTVRMTAMMFLDTDGMIAKDRMKIGGFIDTIAGLLSHGEPLRA